MLFLVPLQYIFTNEHGCLIVNEVKYQRVKNTYGGGRMVKLLSDICLGCIASNLDSISNVRQYLPAVHKEILLKRLSDHDMLMTSYLPHVTYNLFSPVLKRVEFYYCDQLTDDVLVSLARSGCKLKELTIKKCSNVTEVGLQKITRGQDELTYFYIKSFPGLGDKGLMHLKSKNLTTFRLQNCRDVTSECIKTAITNNPFINVVNLNDSVKLDDTLFPVIATTLRENLEKLHCRDIHCMSDSSLSMIAEHCPNLHTLDLLGSSKITKLSVEKVFQNLRKLKNLDISYCPKLQNQPDVHVLTQMPSTLQELSLCGVFITDRDILVSAVQRLENLRKVRLCGVPSLDDDALEEILKAVGGNLERLDLSGCREITDHGLRAITKYCHSLEELDLTQVKNVTGESLLRLFKDETRADLLLRLNLRCSVSKFNEDLLYTVISKCHNLEMLDIAGHLFVTDDIVLSIAENCPKLRELYIKGCKMVTDTAICEIACRCPLTILSISGLHNLTDKSIFALANSCHYLEELYLSGCALISRVALRYLQDCCITRVYIMHKVPNAASNMLMAKNLDTGEFCRADLMN
ncbi:F-box/LRR-repeat protein fbxl-1-like isoform X2 [Lineus longissimus]|uniref:F-box/LRR-repeat protein fbxl-1-like isoform X2 n=1 Tax=Lineus longissimus TaxID=88925 RepID=UPI00315C7EE7